jgi:hypothetical protein
MKREIRTATYMAARACVHISGDENIVDPMVLYRANHTLRRRLLSIDSRACLTLFPRLSHDLIDNAQRPFDLFLPLFVLKYSQSLVFLIDNGRRMKQALMGHGTLYR